MWIVLINLIDNVWKYLYKYLVLEIVIGKKQNVFFVRDNGVGFDMWYVDKLFGVFQCLYGKDEFEGIGIGLVIVVRIIYCYGGDIWVESVVDYGVMFYFILLV